MMTMMHDAILDSRYVKICIERCNMTVPIPIDRQVID